MLTPLYREREQTEVKHRCLERYLQAAARILGTWSDFVYVDCCAGPWRANGENLEDTSFSRAIQVLKVARQELATRSGRRPSIRCLLIEKDDEAYSQLEDYAKKQTEMEVVARHWDFSEHMDDIVRFVRRTDKSFSFVLVDPTGYELAYPDVIAPLLKLCPGEMLINLMTSFMTRFIGDETKAFYRAVGVENITRIRAMLGPEQEEEIVRAYCEQVRATGSFRYVCDLPVMKPDQDAFHYYLVYATRNIRGVEVFKDTERAVVPFMHETRAEAQEYSGIQRSGGQLTLPGFQSGLYRERRYTDFRRANLIRAKHRLHSLLQSGRRISYEDIWGEAMQFSGVQPADLRQWLRSLEQDGRLVVLNRAPNERPFFYKKHHVLEYRGAQSHPEANDLVIHRRR